MQPQRNFFLETSWTPISTHTLASVIQICQEIYANSYRMFHPYYNSWLFVCFPYWHITSLRVAPSSCFTFESWEPNMVYWPQGHNMINYIEWMSEWMTLFWLSVWAYQQQPGSVCTSESDLVPLVPCVLMFVWPHCYSEGLPVVSLWSHTYCTFGPFGGQ